MSSNSRLITSLSTDCLGHVMKYLRGESICRLFSCSPRMAQLMSSVGCVTEFRIYQRHLFDMSQSISPVVNFKGLKTLSIKLVGLEPIIRFLCTKVLYQLPQSLLMIEFSFRNAEECWLRDTPRLPNECYVPPSSQPPFDFASRFPSLHSLHLRSQRLGFPSQFAYLRNNDLAHLPPSLTSLKLFGNSDISSIGLANIPKGLEVLKLRSINEKPSNWQKTLSSLPFLHTLRLHTMDFGYATHQWPSTLKSFQIKDTGYWNPEYADFLPQTLHVLHMRFSSIYSRKISLARLPSQLLSLHMASSSIMDDVKHLPKHMTVLDLLNCPAWTNISVSDLPSSLTHLHLPEKNSSFNEAWILGLPSSLRLLSISTLSPSAYKSLPPRLEALRLSRYLGGEVRAIQKPNLPATLWMLGTPQDPFYRLPTAFNPILSDLEEPFNPTLDTPKLIGGWKSQKDIVLTSDIALLVFAQTRTSPTLDLTMLSIYLNRPAILRHALLFGDSSRNLLSADPNLKDSYNESIMYRLSEWMFAAISHGALDVLKMLHLEFRVPLIPQLIRPGKFREIHPSDSYYLTLAWLVDMGYDLLAKDENTEQTIFHIAASQRNIDLFKWLKEHWQAIAKSYQASHNGETISWRAAINAKSQVGTTPLRIAFIGSGHSTEFCVLDWLVQNEADLTTIEKFSTFSLSLQLRNWLSEQSIAALPQDESA